MGGASCDHKITAIRERIAKLTAKCERLANSYVYCVMLIEAFVLPQTSLRIEKSWDYIPSGFYA